MRKARRSGVFQSLEPRRLLAFGQALHVVDDSSGIQLNAGFGSRVMTDDIYSAVAAMNTSGNGKSASGRVAVYDSETGQPIASFESPNPIHRGQFGYSIDVDNDQLIVGTGREDRVYTFDINSGEQTLAVNLPDPTLADTHRFGGAIAVDDDHLVVGSDAIRGHAGAVHLFDRESGDLLTSLQSPVLEKSDTFGLSVALSGEHVIVGEPGRFGSKAVGQVFVFEKATGNLVHTITNPSSSTNDRFGHAVTTVGSLLLIGAPEHDSNGLLNVGRVFAFEVSDASLVREFAIDTAAIGDKFGSAISASESHVLIGAANRDGANDGANNAGAAYLFDLETGEQLRSFVRGTEASLVNFGASVSLFGERAMIGVARSSLNSQSGVSFLYDVNTGTTTHLFEDSFDAAQDRFGTSVSVTQNRVLVGAPFDDTGGRDVGSAHLINGRTGESILTIESPDAWVGSEFGNAVALTPNRIAVAAHRSSSNGNNHGRAYLFENDGQLIATLDDPSPQFGEFSFGASLSASDTWVVVGAPYDRDSESNAEIGGAHIYDAQTGAFHRTLLHPSKVENARFGMASDIVGNEVLIGTPHSQGGRADLFSATTGDHLQSYLAPLDAIESSFGESVAFDENVAVIAAPDFNSSGRVYVFDRATGDLAFEIEPPNNANIDDSVRQRFGASIAVSDNILIVGSAHESEPGAAYLFSLRDGTFVQSLATTGDSVDWFGRSVDIDNEGVIAVGAPRAHGLTYEQGQVYLFDGDGVNQAPVAQDDVAETSADQAVAIDVVANDLDPNSQDFLQLVSATIESVVTDGASVIERDTASVRFEGQVLEFDPGEDFLDLVVGETATVTVRYQVSDDHAVAATGTGQLSITVVNEPSQVAELLYEIDSPGLDGHSQSRFGYGADATQTYTAVGAPQVYMDGSLSGQVDIFSTSTGELVRSIENPFPSIQGSFGWTVAIAGDRIVIGAPYFSRFDDFVRTGRAYLYDIPTGDLIRQFNPPNATSLEFGHSLAIHGDKVLIGAPGKNNYSGTAYLFNMTTGELLFELPTPTFRNRWHGDAVALTDTVALVGSPATRRDDIVNGFSAGSVEVFDVATGAHLQTLESPEGQQEEYFGASILVHENRWIIGAPWGNFPDTRVGRVYIYDVDANSWAATIRQPFNQANSEFGYSLDAEGDTLVIGGRRNQVYSYSLSTGRLRRVPAVENSSSNIFGTNVRIVDGNILVTDWGADERGFDTGAAYWFTGAAQTPSLRLFSQATSAFDHFGNVAIASDRMVATSRSNRAFLFDIESGNLVASLVGQAGGYGRSLAINDSFLAVAAPLFDRDVGRVYIYDTATGSFLYHLDSPNPARRQFGISIALHGDRLAVSGRAEETYLYDLATGTQVGLIERPTGAQPVALNQHQAVVGYPSDSSIRFSAGSIMLADRDTGMITEVVSNPTPNQQDLFGSTVEATDDFIVVGAPGDSTARQFAGAIYVFDNGANLLATILNPRPDDWREFGRSFSVAGNRLLVYPQRKTDETRRNERLNESVVFYDLPSGEPIEEIVYPRQTLMFEPDNFGAGNDLNDEYLVLSAASFDGETKDRGRVLVYRHALPTQNQPPQAEDDFAAIQPDETVSVDVIANDRDPLDQIQLLAGSVNVISATRDSDQSTIPLDATSITVDGNSISFDPGDDLRFLSDGASATVVIQYTVVDDDNPPLSDNGLLTINVQAPVQPNLVTGQLANLTNEWTEVTLDREYRSMIVVATPSYPVDSPPLVTRVRNAEGNRFEIRLQRVDGQVGPVTGSVHYLVVEEGQYNVETHGIEMEAVRFRTSRVDSAGSWVGLNYTDQLINDYQQPVVVGQVLTHDDPSWSVFWARGTSLSQPPTANAVWIGHHVGEDPQNSRASEILGFIVVEAGAGTVGRGTAGELNYDASIREPAGGGFVQGSGSHVVDSLSEIDNVVATQMGMTGSNGSWAVLTGSAANSVDVVFDEDTLSDDERSHGREHLALFAFGVPQARNAIPRKTANNFAAAIDRFFQRGDEERGKHHFLREDNESRRKVHWRHLLGRRATVWV